MDQWRQGLSLEAPPFGPVRRLRRRHYRHYIHSLAYLNLDQSNGGILRNLGESGIAVQAVAPLCLDQEIRLRFDLANPRVRVEGTGRVAWADPAGQAGIEFLSISQRSRRGLREWIFTQLLTVAQQATGDSNVVEGNNAAAAELLFSSASRPAIRLPEASPAWPGKEQQCEERAPGMYLAWLPFSISAPALSRLVDGLILLSAVLLFAVIGMAMIGAVPAWPIALSLVLGVAGVFAIVYRFLFLSWIGGTPGSYLAQITNNSLNGKSLEAEDRPRFR